MPPPASVSSPAHESSESVIAQLPGNFTTDDLLIALQKDKNTCTQSLLSRERLLYVLTDTTCEEDPARCVCG